MSGNDRNSGYERNANDWYVEPASAVRALLEKERIVGAIHDPACGGGNIPRVAMEFGYPATGADIVDRGFGPVRDFMKDDQKYDNIISNPPFGIATDFTLSAIAALKGDWGRVCILQRLAWLEGHARHAALFAPGFLHRVWVSIGRISMPPGGSDVPAKGGSVAYAWFVFGRSCQASPAMGWL